MDTLNDIISGLKWGNLDAFEAHNRILNLFNNQQKNEHEKVINQIKEEWSENWDMIEDFFGKELADKIDKL